MNPLDDLLVRAALAALGVALATGLLGCFVVWRRMAYFGDATAHAAILGVAVGLGLGLPVTPAILVVAGTMAVLVVVVAERGWAVDTALAVLSHGALALGLLAATALPPPRPNLESWLFGDVLTVGRGDLLVIWIGAAVVATLVRWHWALLLTSTLSPDLARAAGMDPRRGALILSLLIAGAVAIATQVVGALLVTALLVIPAAAARGVSRTPEGMAAAACAIGAAAALGGLGLAVVLDAAVGPAVVVVAAAIFALTAVLRRA